MNSRASTLPPSPCLRSAVFLVFAAALAFALPGFGAPTITNPGFESNAVFTNGPGYLSGNNAVITGWTTNSPDRVGLNPGTNFSDFANASAIPEGVRAAFIQSVGPQTTLSTTVTGLTAGTWYRVQFRASWRGVYTEPQGSYQINGEPPVSFVASPTTNPYYTINAIFRATAATAPLIIGCTPVGGSGDATLLVDNFTITAATSIVVTTAADTVAGSLRAALTTAAGTTAFNVITFAAGLNGATLTLTGGEIAVNDAGGVVIDASALSNSITISGGNTSRILNVGSSGLLALRALTLKNGNGGGGDGGALYNLGSTAITACTFTGNSTGSGGAIRSDGGSMTLTNCTLSGNSASPAGGGGAIVNGTNSIMFLTQCTVSGNSAGDGSGIYNQGTFTLVNSIVAGNTGSSAETYNRGALTYVGANIAPNVASFGTVSGPSPLTADPLLSPLASNGGPTQTMAIASGSPARNAAVGSTSTTDQRGFPVVGTPDIGAFEMQGGGTFTLGATTYSAFEGGVAEIVINRAGNLSGLATVVLYTTTGTASTADFTARANSAASAVTFLDGQTTATVAIPITADSLTETNETFTVTLASPTPTGATVGTPSTATVTIHDAVMVTKTTDDGSAGTLRAVISAAASSTPHAISFAPALAGKTITLASEITIGGADVVTIDASSIGGLTLSGSGVVAGNRLFSVAAGGNLSLRRLTLTGGGGGGNLNANFGGAIYEDSGATLSLNECTLKNNTAALAGGAIADNSGALTLRRCTLSGNSASTGGGIYSFTPTNSNSVWTSLEHCTVSSNTATGNGGGGGVFNQNGIMTLIHCTITGNTAAAGAGSGVGGNSNGSTQTIVEKCIIAGNTNSDVDYVSGGTTPFTSAGENVIGTGNATGTFILFGDDVIGAASPLLGALADNGGFTQTRALLPGSPAIDRASGSIFTADQRGFMINGIADSGAYESQQGGVFDFVGGNGQLHVVHAGEPVIVTVQRSSGFLGPATVRVFTASGSAPAAAYTARPNTSASDISFADGELTKDISISTAKNAGDGNFTILLGSPTPTGASSIGPVASQFGVVVGPIVVTNVNEDGPGSLRQAIAASASSLDATTGGVAPTITFASTLSGQTITLGSEIVIGGGPEILIDASTLPKGITIDGAGYTRLFSVDTGGTLSLRGLTLTGGNGVGASYNGYGGAIMNYHTLTLSQCTLSGNSASQGGGAIMNYGNLTLNQCTLTGNSTPLAGGAISDNEGILALNQCTISGNVAKYAGAMAFNVSTFTLTNSIVAGNTATGLYPDISNSGPPGTPVGVNFIGDTTDSNLSGGSTILTGDPKLGPLADNGGATKTMALQSGSPAINAGSGSTVTTDQRGLPIIGTPDLGACEAQLGGSFAFNSVGYYSNEGSSTTITINRLGGSVGTASVLLSTATGTASATDFTAITNQVVSFGDGETSKNVTINTTNDALVEADETFTLKLSSPSVGTSLGSPSTATVTIWDTSALTSLTDAVNPATPVITSPANNASVNLATGASLTLIGTATDNKGVGSVYVYDGKSNFLGTASLDTPGAPSTVWRFTHVPATGNNTLQAVSSDVAGNTSNINSALITFKVLRPLVVNISGYGSVTSGFSPSSFREVGKPFTVTATAGTGYLFNGWTVLSGNTLSSLGLSANALLLPTLTAIHREGLALRASFVPNPYLAVGASGTFSGGIHASSTLPATGGTGPGGVGTAVATDTEGGVSFIVQTTSAFSGRLMLDGTSFAMAGAFDPSGVARFGASRGTTFSVVRTDKPSLAVALTINLSTKQITGNVWQTGGLATTAVSDVTADLSPYSITNPVPAAYLGAAGASGIYTTVFNGNTSGSLTTAQYPQANGYATVTLTKTGNLTLTGVLADGTPVTASTAISGNKAWHLFSPLYNTQGFLAGDMTFDLTNPATDLSGLNTIWVRPVLDAQYYPLGWQDGLLLGAFGAKYTVPTGASVIPGLPVSNADGNANLGFTGGLLNSSVNKTVSISTTDVVTNTPADSSFKLTINRTAGTFSGTFTHTDGTKPSFNGVIFQKGSAAGFGFFQSTAPAVKDYLGQSGSVYLAPQP